MRRLVLCHIERSNVAARVEYKCGEDGHMARGEATDPELLSAGLNSGVHVENSFNPQA